MAEHGRECLTRQRHWFNPSVAHRMTVEVGSSRTPGVKDSSPSNLFGVCDEAKHDVDFADSAHLFGMLNLSAAAYRGSGSVERLEVVLRLFCSRDRRRGRSGPAAGLSLGAHTGAVHLRAARLAAASLPLPPRMQTSCSPLLSVPVRSDHSSCLHPHGIRRHGNHPSWAIADAYGRRAARVDSEDAGATASQEPIPWSPPAGPRPTQVGISSSGGDACSMFPVEGGQRESVHPGE